MPRIINSYTIDELCNEHRKIIISTQRGVEIGIEVEEDGTHLYLYLGGKIVKQTFDYIIEPARK